MCYRYILLLEAEGIGQLLELHVDSVQSIGTHRSECIRRSTSSVRRRADDGGQIRCRSHNRSVHLINTLHRARNTVPLRQCRRSKRLSRRNDRSESDVLLQGNGRKRHIDLIWRNQRHSRLGTNQVRENQDIQRKTTSSSRRRAGSCCCSQ